MANHWYVQHNGKLYGPLASGELKRLAAEGKVKPTTQVRLGTEGQWGPASSRARIVRARHANVC